MPDNAPPGSNEAARKTLNEILVGQINTLIGYRRGVLETGEPDAIHKLRVTTRRLQASLDMLQSESDDERAHRVNAIIKKLKDRLRRSRRKLANLRNTDVFLEMLADSTRKSGRRGKRYELFAAILRARRDRYDEESRAYLKKRDFDDFVEILDRINSEFLNDHLSEARSSEVADESSGAKENARRISGPAVSQRVAARAAERLDERFREFQRLALASHPGSHPAELHQVRIAAKRLRYLLELLSMMQVGEFEKELRWLRAVQEKIGNWHDLHAIEEEIIGTVSRRSFMREHLAGSAEMLAIAANFRSRRIPLARNLFPIKPPRSLAVVTNRLVKALRREAHA